MTRSAHAGRETHKAVTRGQWMASGALWADGTPMAVAVSADGRIASGVVGGGPAVLELLGAGVLAESN